MKINKKSLAPLYITKYTVTTSLGCGVEENLSALKNEKSGLTKLHFKHSDLDTWIGKITKLDEFQLENSLSEYDCRNNRLIWLALHQDNFGPKVKNLIEKYSNKRIGVFFGTSTSGIQTTEDAYRSITDDEVFTKPYNYHKTHHLYSGVNLIKKLFNLTGLGISISTACSSSSKAFASAQRAIQAGLCDAAIVGGADSLCLTTLYGFNSLQLLSPQICMPFDNNRQGLSIGEGAGFAILEKQGKNLDPLLIGYGESSDAFHMSSPDPEGVGAIAAIDGALNMAELQPSDIDYINLHGTGTLSNDKVESYVISSVFKDIICSSTKGWTGHTLGAAGVIEAIYSLLAMKEHLAFKNMNINQLDTNVFCNIALKNVNMNINKVMSSSFGFGGSNCSLIFGKNK